MTRQAHVLHPKNLTASLSRDKSWVVAQCLEVDVASQGQSEKAALANLAQALELHLAPPVATSLPKIRKVALRVPVAAGRNFSRRFRKRAPTGNHKSP